MTLLDEHRGKTDVYLCNLFQLKFLRLAKNQFILFDFSIIIMICIILDIELSTEYLVRLLLSLKENKIYNLLHLKSGLSKCGKKI